MFKFWKNRSRFEPIKAEELQVGDRFVTNLSPVVALHVVADDKYVSVVYDRTSNGKRLDQVSQRLFLRKQYITIVKR